jgi:hypothetical protein
MSFTTGSLLYRESVQLAELYQELGNWSAVRDRVVSENLLQARTLNTLKRVCCEVVSRLKTLSSGELHLLVAGSSQEQNYLLWLAICRRYSFIADFAVEVLREQYITYKTDLRYEDFDAFFSRKSEWHTELNEIHSTTRNRLRQVLFKILRDVGLLTADHTINPVMLGERLLAALPQSRGGDVLFFPAFAADLRKTVR